MFYTHTHFLQHLLVACAHRHTYTPIFSDFLQHLLLFQWGWGIKLGKACIMVANFWVGPGYPRIATDPYDKDQVPWRKCQLQRAPHLLKCHSAQSLSRSVFSLPRIGWCMSMYAAEFLQFLVNASLSLP